MPVTELQRTQVHVSLTDFLGGAVADNMMQMMPPVDWSDLVRKADIAEMATKADIANMATKTDIANMATKTDIAWIKVIFGIQTSILCAILAALVMK